jgi:hypothetical protein
MVGSTWYLEKLAAGFSVSPEAEVKIRAALERAYKGAAQPPPEPYPLQEARTAKGATRKRKTHVQTKLEVTTQPAVTQATSPPPPPPASFRSALPPAPVASQTMAYIDSKRFPLEVADIIRVPIKKHVIDGVEVNIDAEKGKVYDLKARYLGRWDAAKNTIVAYAESDSEA